MALRTTRQMVEVLGTTSDSPEILTTRQTVAVIARDVGAVRVYRQMIEVLAAEVTGDVYEVYAENAADLSTSSVGGKIITKDVEDTIELTYESYVNLEGYSELTIEDALEYSGSWNRTVSSDLEIVQDLGLVVFRRRNLTSTIVVTQEIEFVGPRQGPASTAITVSGTAYRCQTLIASASNTIIPAGIVQGRGTLRYSASNALSLLSLADRGIFGRSTSTEIELVDVADLEYIHRAFNTIALTSGVIEGEIRALAANSLSLVSQARKTPLNIGPSPTSDVILPATVITMQQGVTLSIKMQTASSQLALSQSVFVHQPWYLFAESHLQTITQVFDPETLTMIEVVSGLNNTATFTKSGTAKLIHQYLQPIQSANGVLLKSGALEADAENILSVSDILYRNITGSAHNYLTFTGVATGGTAYQSSSLIAVTQIASRLATRSRETESVLTLDDAFGYVLVKNVYTSQYHPFIGKGQTGDPIPPPSSLTGPLSGITDAFILVYPATGAVEDSIILRSPSFGNKDRLGFNRIVRETRGGTLIVYADSIWPKIQTLALSFSGLTQAQKDAFLDFVDDHLGLEIGIVDWEHRYWKGVIMSPDSPAIQDDRNSYSVSFEFEGEMDPTWTL